MSSGKKPTHQVSILHAQNGFWYNVGVGWINEKGTISIRLNPFVSLAQMAPDDHLIVAPVKTQTTTREQLPEQNPPDVDTCPLEKYDDDNPF
jgi:hypothetical protein